MSQSIETRAPDPLSRHGHLLILNYHAVTADSLGISDWCFLDAGEFRKHLQYLKRHYDALPLGVAVDKLAQGDITRPTVAITFDDGYQNNYDIAYPILQDENLPATIFITTGLVNTDNTLWYCRLLQALTNSTADELIWNEQVFNLSTLRQREKASRKIQSRLKLFTPDNMLDELATILRSLGEDPDSPMPTDSPYRMLSAESIRKMAAEGLVNFGAHTHTHPILSLLSRDQQRIEIETSIRCTQKYTQQDCKLFAYPNGRLQDFNLASLELLRDCGVNTAVTVVEGVNDQDTPRLLLMRHGIGSDCSMEDFAAILNYDNVPPSTRISSPVM